MFLSIFQARSDAECFLKNILIFVSYIMVKNSETLYFRKIPKAEQAYMFDYSRRLKNFL